MARPRGGYFDAEGNRIPGVTTVIGALDKPALVGWAGKLCAQAGWDAAKRGAVGPPYWRDVCYGVRDRAAEDGTAAHDLFERHLQGQSPAYIRQHAESQCYRDGAWQAYENAKQWLGNLALTFEVWPHERPLISEIYGYAGTPDALARDADGKVWLADWKTGGLYPEMVLQMAAYRELLHEVEGISVVGAHLVRFSRDSGDFTHHQIAGDALDLGWAAFRPLLDVYVAMGAVRKRMK